MVCGGSDGRNDCVVVRRSEFERDCGGYGDCGDYSDCRVLWEWRVEKGEF